MTFDRSSNELGRLAGSLEAMSGSVALLHRKLDNAAEDRGTLVVEVATVHERLEQIDASMAEKLDDLKKNMTLAEARILVLENWQNRMIAKVSVLGTIGVFLGWIIVKFVVPAFGWTKT